MNNLHRIMEIVWLLLFAGSVVWLTFEYFRSEMGFVAIQDFLLIPFIALAMYFFRRFIRKRMEARQRRENGEE
ncbi:hypothetical protein [Halocola ammonii]